MKLIPKDKYGILDIVDTSKTFVAIVTCDGPNTYHVLQHDNEHKYHFRKIHKDSGVISPVWISCAFKNSIQECLQKNTGSRTIIYAFDDIQEFLDSPL